MSHKNDVAGYTDYFRQLAVKHKDILHDPLAETGNAKTKGTLRFGRTSASEILSALPANAGEFFVTIELYDTKLSSDNQHDIKSYYKGAFMIVKHANANAFDKQLEAHADCERIGYDFLNKIWDDHYGVNVKRCETPFQNIDYNEGDIVFVSGLFDGQRFGWRCEFGFSFNQSKKIAVAPAAGIFV
jgi:hypothetical protein